MVSEIMISCEMNVVLNKTNVPEPRLPEVNPKKRTSRRWFPISFDWFVPLYQTIPEIIALSECFQTPHNCRSGFYC